MTTIFFATDVHGSDICWMKFLNTGKFYKADVIILGGDMTGKAVVPIVQDGNQTYRAVLSEQQSILHGDEELQAMIKKIKGRGYYPYLTTPDELEDISKNPEQVKKIFRNEVLKTVTNWLELADQKLAVSRTHCYVAPGNDDMFEIDGLINSSKWVHLAEGKSVAIDDHHEMISTGWSNPTPWHTFREESEEKLEERILQMVDEVKDNKNCIFNLHPPPYGSTLDDAPELTRDMRPKYAGRSLIPVGSRAVRKVIEERQPLLGLFGHIHEGKGASRIGHTLCINPGSLYEEGYLSGALINLGQNKINSYILTGG